MLPPPRPAALLAAALVLSLQASAMPSVLERAGRVHQQALWCDANMLLLRQNAPFWENWARLDATIESMFFQQYAESAQRITWHDPGTRLMAAGWLLTELARNVEYLVVLGRDDDAERMLAVAEKLAQAASLRRDPIDILLFNTMARLLFVGWRDSADPLSELEIQSDNVVRNMAGLRKGLRFREQGLRALPLPSAPSFRLVEGALAGRVDHLLPNLALSRLAGMERHASTFVAASPWPLPVLSRSMPDRHSASADEAALALNLPFTLVPVGAELERFLTENAASLVPGAAALLGAGDGGEALRTAGLPGIEPVSAVDHSMLACERLRRAAGRLAHVPATRRLSIVWGDVRDSSFPEASVSLVVASHLLEYLSAEDRSELFSEFRRWMKPGGTIFLLVHAAAGEKLESLLSGYANVSGARDASGVLVRITSLVPAQADAAEVKQFLTPEALESELDRGGLTEGNGYVRTLRVAPAPGGFVEITVILTLLNP